nr:MAG TPA: PsbA, PsbB, PsbC, PsbD, PsbE-FCP supercomplex, PLANT PROTEIN [Caudoviricetes sp.]
MSSLPTYPSQGVSAVELILLNPLLPATCWLFYSRLAGSINSVLCR